MSDGEIKVRKGVGDLTRDQAIALLKYKMQQMKQRDSATAEFLPTRDDENADLVSEVNPMGAIAKIHQKWMIQVYDPNRTVNLLKAWDIEEDRVMMMLKRQRVWELMAIKNAASVADEANKEK